MNKGLKSVLAGMVLLLGLFLGTGALVNMSGRMWGFLFFAGAVMFWLWITREERSAQDKAERAVDAANDKLDEMERAARRIEIKADVPAAGRERVAIRQEAQQQEEAVPQQQTPVQEPAAAPDDLTRINGIGARFAEMLHQAGITTYKQLAALSAAQILDIIRTAGGRKSASMETWAAQAKLAAEGNWDALEQMQQEMNKRP